MELDVAKKLLSTCVKHELRDHAFGIMDVDWYDGDKNVAFGYFGGGRSIVSVEVNDGKWANDFEGEEAHELLGSFASVHIERVDATGPEEFELK